MLTLYMDRAIVIFFIASFPFLVYSRILLKSAIANKVSTADMILVWGLYIGSWALLVSSVAGMVWVLWSWLH